MMRVNPGTSFREKLLDPDGSFGVVVPSILSHENGADSREAVANFRAYLSILREWDRKECLETGNALGSDAKTASVDSGLGQLL